jgi:hypothetical protein
MANYAGCHAIYTSVFVIPRSFVKNGLDPYVEACGEALCGGDRMPVSRGI